MNFPIILNEDGAEDPEVPLYYKIAANGVFQVRETPFYRAVTQHQSPLPGLLLETEGLEYDLPRLPRALLEDVLAFFAQVYREHGGEAIVILFYSHERREYRVGVPPQCVPGYYLNDGSWRGHLDLDYGSADRPEGFLRLGTIHSHAYLNAYASETDRADESFEDGLHIVFGHLDRPQLSSWAAFVANRVRFTIAPREILEPCAIPSWDAPPGWMDQVTRKEEPWTRWYVSAQVTWDASSYDAERKYND